MRTRVFGRAVAIAVLAATMLAWGSAAAQNVDPLTLELASSRALCTANTLTELSWTISGGEAAVHADHRRRGGRLRGRLPPRRTAVPIPMDPMGTVPGTTPSKTFSVSVTDSRATPVAATDEVQVELAEALSPPTGIEAASLSVVVGVSWTPKPAPAEGVSSAGEISAARAVPRAAPPAGRRVVDIRAAR